MPRKNGNQADRSHDLSAVKGYHSYVPPTTIYPPMPSHQLTKPVYMDLAGNPVSIEDFPFDENPPVALDPDGHIVFVCSYLNLPVAKLSKVQRLKLWFAETRESICDAWEFIVEFWQDLHHTDLGDSEHYANGFRKFSAYEPAAQIRFIVSVIALIVSVITLIMTR